MKYQINLIYSKKEEQTKKIFYFIYHYLRYILVITQIIVIFVFFNKIKYDQEIIDYQETISQQKEIINVSKPLTKEYLLIKKKVDKIEFLTRQQELIIDQITYLLSIFPKGIILSNMEYKEGSLIIIGSTNDPLLVKAFYSKLKKDNIFQNVVLKNIEKKEFNYNFIMILSDFKEK